MKKRPIAIWLVGLGLILSPIYYYFEKVFVARLDWTDPISVFSAMSIAKLIGIAIGPVVGALVLRVRPVSWYAIIGYAIYTIGANTAILLAGHMRVWVFALNVPTALLVILYFVRREVMSPYFNPRLRWWESDRIAVRAATDVALQNGETVRGETLDISPTGLFLATDTELPIGESFEVSLDVGKETVKARARTVWQSDGTRRPRGVGARFDEPSSHLIRAALKKLSDREFPRLPFKLFVDVKRDKGERAEISGRTFDVSEGGCFLVTDVAFAMGESIELTLHLIDEPVVVSGDVVWISDGRRIPRGVGVRFRGRPSALAEQLKRMQPGVGDAPAAGDSLRPPPGG